MGLRMTVKIQPCVKCPHWIRTHPTASDGRIRVDWTEDFCRLANTIIYPSDANTNNSSPSWCPLKKA